MTDAGGGLPPFPVGATVPSAARALVLTVSDGVAGGTRQDESGMALADRLAMAGFRVDRQTVPDDRGQIEAALRAGATEHVLLVSTGGTGLTPRDVTPQATQAIVDYEVPGLAEAMRAAGRAKTPMADLSRGIVGVVGRSLVVNVPGSPRAALESLVALEPTLAHALETLAGPFDHSTGSPASGLDAMVAAAGRQAPLPPPPSIAPVEGATAEASSPSMPPSTSSPAAEVSRAPGAGPSEANDPWRDLPRPEDRT